MAVEHVPAQRVASAERGRHWMEHFECARCHSGLSVPMIADSKHCVQCHEQIHAGSFEAPRNVLKEWQQHIVNLREVPRLDHLGELLRTDWLAQYLQAPRDLRPALGASMPRLALSDEQVADIVAALTSSTESTEINRSTSSHIAPAQERAVIPDTVQGLNSGELAAGRALFSSRSCGSCHAFERPARSAVGAAPNLSKARRLAPDLRHTRSRLRSGVLVPWLLNPQAFKPETLMPNHGLSEDEAQSLARYLLEAPLPAVQSVHVARLPVLERPVTYAEVERRVLRKVCWHCHAQPDLARGDGGPGMSGGFGYPARGLDLSTYAAVLGGYRDARGEAVSVFKATADGTPLLVAVLLARQTEEQGFTSELRGMPLGLPALTAEEIQLVESWIEQGRSL